MTLTKMATTSPLAWFLIQVTSFEAGVCKGENCESVNREPLKIKPKKRGLPPGDWFFFVQWGEVMAAIFV